MSLTSTIPLNDLRRTYTCRSEEFKDAAERTLSSGWWLNGTETSTFCESFRKYVGARYCIGVGNGTDALEIAIRAVVDKIGLKGCEVVTVANAGGYSTIACRLLGLTPAYADIDYETQLMSIECKR